MSNHKHLSYVKNLHYMYLSYFWNITWWVFKIYKKIWVWQLLNYNYINLWVFKSICPKIYYQSINLKTRFIVGKKRRKRRTHLILFTTSPDTKIHWIIYKIHYIGLPSNAILNFESKWLILFKGFYMKYHMLVRIIELPIILALVLRALIICVQRQ